MRRGTTPTHIFSVSVDLREASVWITYAQAGEAIIEKTGRDLVVTENAIVCTLTQADTLKLRCDEDVLIQIRYVTPDGAADASEIMRLTVQQILKEGEITHV